MWSIRRTQWCSGGLGLLHLLRDDRRLLLPSSELGLLLLHHIRDALLCSCDLQLHGRSLRLVLRPYVWIGHQLCKQRRHVALHCV